MIQRFTLYLNDQNSAIASALDHERRRLMAEGRVYVRPHVRRWPGGLPAAQKALVKIKEAEARRQRLARAASQMLHNAGHSRLAKAV